MWGSDAIAEAIEELGFACAAVNPGASYRGLHDSFVNHLGGRVKLLVCLHEEHAVALAHGMTKVTGRPALAIVHSNVGLMHASMALYNAWVDRAPVILLNAAGPMDAMRRRPWIEWIHTAQDQGALVRHFVKWDDQPASAAAAVEALAQAWRIAQSDPAGPVFVCLDVSDQEAPLDGPAPRIALPPRLAPPEPAPGAGREIAEALAAARRPVIMAGRVGRSAEAWQARIALAERLGAAVVTDVKTQAAFPVPHAHHVGAPGFALDAAQKRALGEADYILALDWIDLAGTLESAGIARGGRARLASTSLDIFASRGWVKNLYRQPAVDIALAAHPDALVRALLTGLPERARSPWFAAAADAPDTSLPSLTDEAAYRMAAEALAAIRREMPLSLTRTPLGWPAALHSAAEPLDYLGRDGGEGLGSGPGLAVGAALALAGTGRIAAAIIGDGDFLMGATALWTAAAEKAPLLLLVAANGVYGNDVVHQERIARERGRPTRNKWVGQRIDAPRIDLVAMARAQGAGHAVRIRPDDPDAVARIVEAARHARAGNLALVEIDMPAGR